MSMMDRLRESALEDDDDLFGPEDDLDDLLVSDKEVKERRILGMNAAERMVVSIFLFLTTTVIGTLVLLALKRIDIGL